MHNQAKQIKMHQTAGGSFANLVSHRAISATIKQTLLGMPPYPSTGSKYPPYSNPASATTPACTYALSPTSNTSVGSAGGGYSVTVTGGTGCGWTATSSATWLTITAGASGSGNGSVSYS